MAYIHHHVKRLQPTTNSQDHRSPLPDDENVRESIQNFTITNNSNITYSRPVISLVLIISLWEESYFVLVRTGP